MADQTIHDESVVTTAAVGDEMLIWRVANNDTKRITKANFIGATISGGGTVATGGFTLTVGANSTINGSVVGNMTGGGTLATGGFTLTVPATGTVGLLGTAQTYTQLKTFSPFGINFGQTANLTYFDAGAWPSPPVITSTSTAPTVVHSAQDSFFLRINTVVFFSFTVVISTISGGTGNLRIGSFPFTASALNQPRFYVAIEGIDYPGTAPLGATMFVNQSTNYALATVTQDNAAFQQIPITLFGAGDSVQASGFYYV